MTCGPRGSLRMIFQRPTTAEALVDRIHADLDLVAAKVAKIPANRRPRVMRFMGGEKVMTPGDGSFQNEMIHDFVNKTLVVDFHRPMTVVSTLEGRREGILTVGNHHWPPPCWCLGHAAGLVSERQRVCRVLNRQPETTALLFTGADMDRFAVQRRSHREMTVTALVTAGVESNAQRAGCDPGHWYEPGTINIILLTNMQLTPRAMTRALITATEAKTIALQDLDIRSTTEPRRPATGTDNLIVVQGAGTVIDNAGGHSKMVQLVAEAVSAGVREAVFRQNGIVADRPVVRRMSERGADLWSWVADPSCDCAGHRGELGIVLERLLLEDRYAVFFEAAMALDNARAAGRRTDLSLFDAWCRQVAAEIAGAPVPLEGGTPAQPAGSTALHRALAAMTAGINARPRKAGLQ